MANQGYLLIIVGPGVLERNNVYTSKTDASPQALSLANDIEKHNYINGGKKWDGCMYMSDVAFLLWVANNWCR